MYQGFSVPPGQFAGIERGTGSPSAFGRLPFQRDKTSQPERSLIVDIDRRSSEVALIVHSHVEADDTVRVNGQVFQDTAFEQSNRG